MNEPDGPWAAWRSLNGSREGSAESYEKNQQDESQKPRRNRYDVPRFDSLVIPDGANYYRDYDPNGLPDTLWVEGISTTPDWPTADVDIALLYRVDSLDIDQDAIDYRVFTLEYVTFDGYMDNDDPTGHPAYPPNGGKRMFPGKKTYDDPNPERRNKVRVRAHITPAIENIYIYFSWWDVDDPYTDALPIDTTGSAGGDNKGEGASLLTDHAVTDGSGNARVTFTVTMQPGDNFRIAASPIASKVRKPDAGELTQTMVDSGNLPDTVRLSEMLTVWRKLHVEVDSMAAGLDNPVNNKNLDDTYANTPHAGESGAEINGWDGAQEGKYEGGTLTVSMQTFEIIDNINDSGDDTVYVNGDITPYEDNSASFSDDDSSCPLPRQADTSLMNTAFNDAYIEVVIEPDVYDDDATFLANVGDSLTDLHDVGDPVKQRSTSEDYWMLQIVTCYQGDVDEDQDPDVIYHWHDAVNSKEGDTGIMGYHDAETSLIFLEVISDESNYEQYCINMGWSTYDVAHSATDLEKCTVVHEAGHMFGCDDYEGDIMTFPNNIYGIDLPDKFSDQSISKIRDY